MFGPPNPSASPWQTPIGPVTPAPSAPSAPSAPTMPGQWQPPFAPVPPAAGPPQPHGPQAPSAPQGMPAMPQAMPGFDRSRLELAQNMMAQAAGRQSTNWGQAIGQIGQAALGGWMASREEKKQREHEEQAAQIEQQRRDAFGDIERATGMPQGSVYDMAPETQNRVFDQYWQGRQAPQGQELPPIIDVGGAPYHHTQEGAKEIPGVNYEQFEQAPEPPPTINIGGVPYYSTENGIEQIPGVDYEHAREMKVLERRKAAADIDAIYARRQGPAGQTSAGTEQRKELTAQAHERQHFYNLVVDDLERLVQTDETGTPMLMYVQNIPVQYLMSGSDPDGILSHAMKLGVTGKELEAYNAFGAMASSILREESGAAISQEETLNMLRQIMPGPNATPDSIRANLSRVMNRLESWYDGVPLEFWERKGKPLFEMPEFTDEQLSASFGTRAGAGVLESFMDAATGRTPAQAAREQGVPESAVRNLPPSPPQQPPRQGFTAEQRERLTPELDKARLEPNEAFPQGGFIMNHNGTVIVANSEEQVYQALRRGATLGPPGGN